MLKLDIRPQDNLYERKPVGSNFVAPAETPKCHKIVLKRYETIENSPDNKGVFVISKGIAGLQNILTDGRRSISAIFIEKDMIDSGLCEKTKSGSLVALTSMEGNWVDEANCDHGSAMCSNHSVAIRKSLAQQNKFMIRHCNDLSKKSAMEKIAAFMFECRHRLGLGKNNLTFSLLLQRVDIADYLGLRQETLSRAMTKLERSGLIKVEEGNIVRILDIKRLKQIANGASEQKIVTSE